MMVLGTNYISCQELKKKKKKNGRRQNPLLEKNNINGVLNEQSNGDCQQVEDETEVKQKQNEVEDKKTFMCVKHLNT